MPDGDAMVSSMELTRGAIPRLPPDCPINAARLVEARAQPTADAAYDAAWQAGQAACDGAVEQTINREQRRALTLKPLFQRVIDNGLGAGIRAGVSEGLRAGAFHAVDAHMVGLMNDAGIDHPGVAIVYAERVVLQSLNSPNCNSCINAGIDAAQRILNEVPIHEGNAVQRLRTALHKGIDLGLREGLTPLVTLALELGLQAGWDNDVIKPALAPRGPSASGAADD